MEVYKITNKVTGKGYIGKTVIGYEKRFNIHKKNAYNKVNRRLYDSMNYHGVDNFVVTLLYTCTSLEELNNKEILAIKEHNTLIPNGYNMTIGGDGGYTLIKWSEEKRKDLYAQQALTRTGVKRSEEQKERMSEAQKGKHISLEQREKISIALHNRYKNLSLEEQRKLVQPLIDSNYTRLGEPHSKESKELMSKAKKNKTYDEIYGVEAASYIKEMRKQFFTTNNPKKYIISDITKKEILKLVYSNLTAKEISERLEVSLYKMRQILNEEGITNLQEYRRTEEWRKEHENWLQLNE